MAVHLIGQHRKHVENLANTMGQAIRQDAWANRTTGFGTWRDKATHAQFEFDPVIDQVTLENMFHGSDVAARAAELPPREMLRKPWRVKISSDDGQEEDAAETSGDVLAYLSALEANAHVEEALVWSRVFGGCGVILGADDGRPADEPLDEANIKTLAFLNVIDRRYLYATKWYADPMQPKYKLPEVFEIRPEPIGGGLVVVTSSPSDYTRIHESRLLLFRGQLSTARHRAQAFGWDLSVYQRMNDVLRSFDSAWQAVGNLLTDSSQAVFKLKGLIQSIASEDSNTITTRLQLLDLSRSIARAVVLDADTEDFTREQFSFAGIPDLMDRINLRLASALEMPVMILMGQSPTGMNNEGGGDLQWWYERIEGMQGKFLRPQLQQLARVAMLAKDGPTNGVLPDKWSVEFDPLAQMSEKDRAELRKTVADTDALYLDRGVLVPSEVRSSRFRGDGWNAETELDPTIDVDALDKPADPNADPNLDPENDPADPNEPGEPPEPDDVPKA